MTQYQKRALFIVKSSRQLSECNALETGDWPLCLQTALKKSETSVQIASGRSAVFSTKVAFARCIHAKRAHVRSTRGQVVLSQYAKLHDCRTTQHHVTAEKQNEFLEVGAFLHKARHKRRRARKMGPGGRMECVQSSKLFHLACQRSTNLLDPVRPMHAVRVLTVCLLFGRRPHFRSALLQLFLFSSYCILNPPSLQQQPFKRVSSSVAFYRT